MGTVWEAINEFTQGRFAVKLLGAQHVGGEEARRRLMREASASGRLSHKNVVQVYDVGLTESGDPFLVMQLLKGSSVAGLLAQRGLLEPSQAIVIARAVAKALEVAHEQNIVHRDLTPGNIFLHEDADLGTVVKVLDFGVSKVTDSKDALSTVTGTAIGTPAYMSPEQAKGARGVDHRTDLWALGVVLFEMLSGVRPFVGDTPYAIVAEIISGDIPRLDASAPHVDTRLVQLVARCLERDVERRIASATEMIHRLDDIVQRSAEPGIERHLRFDVDLFEEETLAGVVPKTLASGIDAEGATQLSEPEQPGPEAPAVSAPSDHHTSTSALVRTSPGLLKAGLTALRARLGGRAVAAVVAAGVLFATGLTLAMAFGGSSDDRLEAETEASAVGDVVSPPPEPAKGSQPMPEVSVATPVESLETLEPLDGGNEADDEASPKPATTKKKPRETAPAVRRPTPMTVPRRTTPTEQRKSKKSAPKLPERPW